MKKDTVIINGRDAVISYRESRSHQKDEPKLNNTRVHRVLQELLNGDRSKKHEVGITTLNSFTNLDGARRWNDTRPSNAIVELRKVIPKSGIITFRYVGEKIDRYALINDKNIVDFADNLLKEIAKEL